MNDKKELEKKHEMKPINPPSKPYLKFHEKIDETTGSSNGPEFRLSDGTDLENLTPEKAAKFLDALKNVTGIDDPNLALKVLYTISDGMLSNNQTNRLNQTAALLPMLHPKDETEALLLGQFISLQEAGRKCLNKANNSDMFYHVERLFALSTKLFAQANATIQTLIKYRNGGQQTVQVIHLHNDGQAIVTQNLTPTQNEGGASKKKV